MKEFEGYDKMMAEYYNSNSALVLPLSCWEFYGEHNWSLGNFKTDLDSLNKITKKWDFENIYHNELVHKKSVILITNTDLKIVYATHNIEKMSGYTPEEIVGNSPKMFQGEQTDLKTSKIIRAAIDNQEPFEVSIVNYKKDRSTYLCHIKGFPIRDKKGKLINYIAFEQAA
ncbi:PAS domain S-box-containing protein [Aquimarina amphilecti]|uniref:PAS domain S-box-containing protein n=1 Tax=Aquimarina amphilecti TaxID=1038014 RepID=A0A1H7PPP1_AQUAM|nr:PAS domain-containing protein [Aquimarina amphilecti]SEL37017.1 PAS domain S-box-containing protein [Aquimarina amphilecti]